MKLTKDEKELITRMKIAGISFQLMYFDGYNCINVQSVKDIEKVLDDKNQFIADCFNITTDHLHEYFKYNSEAVHQCTGKTKKGEQCKNYVSESAYSPSEFKLGYHDRCTLHKVKGNKNKQKQS